MGLPGLHTWAWTLFVWLSWQHVGQALAGPQYMVVYPAVLEAGAETQFCASLLHPNETLVMTVTLMSQETNKTLLEKTSDVEFHTCVQFQAPLVKSWEVQRIEVQVRGDTFYSTQQQKVKFQAYQPMTFIQTDKPMYLPGQTVHFRVISLDTKLRPVHQWYDLIELKDPKNNRIGQWLNQTSAGELLQLSYSLNSEASEGVYTVTVRSDGKDIKHEFKVEAYVLPKFDMQVNAPDEINMAEVEFPVEACAKYTFGQPVPGSAELKICTAGPNLPGNDQFSLPYPFCSTTTMQMNKNGCAKFTVKQPIFVQTATVFTYLPLRRHELPEIFLKATVTEIGTGITKYQVKRTKVSSVIRKMSFIDTPKVYNRHSIVEGKIKAVYYNNTPISDLQVNLRYEDELGSHVQKLRTDYEGIAAFWLNTSNSKWGIHLTAEPKDLSRNILSRERFERPVHILSPAVSPEDSSFVIKPKKGLLRCDGEETISIGYSFIGQTQGSVDVIHLVLSRGSIIMQGFTKIHLQHQQVNEGEVSFQVEVSPEMAPQIQLVAYAVLPTASVISHTAEFYVEKCFSHKVSLDFSPSSAVPGEDIAMQVMAQPHSLCGVNIVDQSVLIKEPGKILDADKVFELLPIKKVSSSVPREVQDPISCFTGLGLKTVTNLLSSCDRVDNIHRRPFRKSTHRRLFLKSGSSREYSSSRLQSAKFRKVAPVPTSLPPPPPPPPIETIRSFFPETWIWDLVKIGDSGRKDVAVTVPDTITTWETEAFCLFPQGFGLAPRQKLTVFQPFFLELTMPYSIIRGEEFELKATVFNYLTSCLMVSVIPLLSSDYTLTPLSGDQYTSCLCDKEIRTLSWTMIPSALGAVNVSVRAEAVGSTALCGNEVVSVPERGRIDVVTRPLIVKAEGTEITKTLNWLLCPKGEALTEEAELQLPENVIDGSARASLSVLGDILGRALKNLDGLLRMPFGCGEQNMVLLAPNIYILHYLDNTQQLTAAVRKKATNFMTSGYQRQLNYKLASGAYSTFGSEPGITWLTAFVLRCFVKAQTFIYIDPTNIEEAKAWLMRGQQPDGCFQMSGKLVHNDMKGGVSDSVTLSAYVTAALLEMNMSASDPVLRRSLSCLRESMSDLSNTYTTALMAYVFTLAGEMETRSRLLQYLDTIAIREGGSIHWYQTATKASAALSVEISSYVLMAKLSASPMAEDVVYASGIGRWLTEQQNSYGGFVSTQDTVVALQALALYATVVFSPEGSSTVTVQAPSDQLVFNVNPDNKLLYQEQMLQDMTGNYTLEVKGTACASVQISLHYNIPTPTEATTLSVKVKPEPDCGSKSQRPRLSLELTSMYSGEEHTTNMVILDIKALSGFVPDMASVKRLRGAPLVDRVDQKDDHVLVYLRELTKDVTITHTLELIQEFPVKNLKPAVVKIYDYYQPSDQAETEYIYLCPAA